MDDDRMSSIDAELRPVAERVSRALRAEVPREVAERHEALLRDRASGVRELPRLEQVPEAPVRPLRPRRRRRVAVLALAAAFVLGTSAVAFASDGAVRGDLLYPVDRAVERVQLAMARTPESAARTHLAQAAERIEEIEALAALGGADHIPDTADEAVASADDALVEAQRAGSEEIEAEVFEAIALHVQRLQDVRELLANTPAAQEALDALDRAIAAGSERAREAAERGFGRGGERPAPATERPGRTGSPADAPAPGGSSDGGTDGGPDGTPVDGRGPGDETGSQGDPGSTGHQTAEEQSSQGQEQSERKNPPPGTP